MVPDLDSTAGALASGRDVTRVRPASAEDAVALAEVAAATFALACPPSTTEAAKADFIASALSVAAFERYLGDAGRSLFVVDGPNTLDGAALDGYAMVVHGEPVDAGVAGQLTIRPTAELSKIYVRQGAHGSGIASALLEAAVAAAAARGSAGMWLGTNELNVRAQRFYGKHGFARVGAKTFRLGDVDENDYVYERAL